MNKIECVMNVKNKEVRDRLIKNVNFSYSLKRNAVIEHVQNTYIFLSLKRRKNSTPYLSINGEWMKLKLITNSRNLLQRDLRELHSNLHMWWKLVCPWKVQNFPHLMSERQYRCIYSAFWAICNSPAVEYQKLGFSPKCSLDWKSLGCVCEATTNQCSWLWWIERGFIQTLWNDWGWLPKEISKL